MGWPEGTGRIVLDEIDSTSAEAARLAPHQSQPTWILTHRQTRGRGRRGRAWTDPTGNFAASHLMFPQEPLKDIALNSFIAALSLFEALGQVAPAESYALKWPNDVLLNGKKIAGILLETSGRQDQVDWLIIGIGVNLQHAPDLTEMEPRATPPSSIKNELGHAPDAERLLDALAIRFAENRQLYHHQGFEAIRTRWLAHAANLGAVLTARTMRDEITGSFEDVDNDGNLILMTPKGCRAITAADVFF